MRYHLLAADFDGTLAEHGQVPDETIEILKQLRETGRRLVMVSGRRLEPLLELCPWLNIFDRVVAENGALLYRPQAREEETLAPTPPAELVERLRDVGVEPLETGRVIVATWHPHETASLEVIRQLGLDLQIIFNKDAVMLLPSGCNKASGLSAALNELEIAPLNVVAVGDAENDVAMLRMAGASVAVDNALPPVKEICDIVTSSPRGAGVNELCQMILDNDLALLRTRPEHCIPLGDQLDGQPLLIPPYGDTLLVTGGPAGGKSRFAMSFIEQLEQHGAQCCIIDPEGDYQGIENALTIGSADRAPAIEEVIEFLQKSQGHAVVNFFAVEKKERGAYFNNLFHSLTEYRDRTGRPHWLIVDEAHYMAPKDWEPAEAWSQEELQSVLFISAYVEQLSDVVLQAADRIISIADDPELPLAKCGLRLGTAVPSNAPPDDRQEHQALIWQRLDDSVQWFSRREPESSGRRHRQNLLEGEEMSFQNQFLFQGPENKLRLRAKNLREFIKLADGVDDETWLHHLRQHDYSTWFRDVVKDEQLATTAQNVEEDHAASPANSRKMIFDKIRERFEPTAPGS